jgi:hypothetical protein
MGVFRMYTFIIKNQIGKRVSIKKIKSKKAILDVSSYIAYLKLKLPKYFCSKEEVKIIFRKNIIQYIKLGFKTWFVFDGATESVNMDSYIARKQKFLKDNSNAFLDQTQHKTVRISNANFTDILYDILCELGFQENCYFTIRESDAACIRLAKSKRAYIISNDSDFIFADGIPGWICLRNCLFQKQKTKVYLCRPLKTSIILSQRLSTKLHTRYHFNKKLLPRLGACLKIADYTYNRDISFRNHLDNIMLTLITTSEPEFTNGLSPLHKSEYYEYKKQYKGVYVNKENILILNKYSDMLNIDLLDLYFHGKLDRAWIDLFLNNKLPCFSLVEPNRINHNKLLCELIFIPICQKLSIKKPFLIEQDKVIVFNADTPNEIPSREVVLEGFTGSINLPTDQSSDNMLHVSLYCAIDHYYRMVDQLVSEVELPILPKLLNLKKNKFEKEIVKYSLTDIYRLITTLSLKFSTFTVLGKKICLD